MESQCHHAASLASQSPFVTSSRSSGSSMTICSNTVTLVKLRAGQVLTRINLAVAIDRYNSLREPTVSRSTLGD